MLPNMNLFYILFVQDRHLTPVINSTSIYFVIIQISMEMCNYTVEE